MSNNHNQETTMYERIPAVAELNKVPGFNPLKLLRRTISAKTKEPALQLDLPYKKLWFRLANPKGRIRLHALSITEQLAIFEAQIFLDRSDAEPIGNFTACCEKEQAPDGQYIQVAQRAAINEALSDAGYGLQFADVSMREEDRRYGSEIPMPEKEGITEQKAAVVQTSNITATTTAIKEVIPASSMSKPVQTARSTPKPEQAVSTAQGMTTETIPEELPVSNTAPALETEEMELPIAPQNAAATAETAARYTADMPVEQILPLMTLEEAKAVVVDTGACTGWTIEEVAAKRAPSLKFYVYGGYKGENNILRAAARLMLDELAAQKTR